MSSPSPSPSRRIVLALESSGPGGAESMVLRLADALRERGHQVAIASLRAGWMTERAQAARHPVWVAPQRSGLDPLWIPRFARRLRYEGAEILHSHEFAMNIYGGAAARLAGIPSIATIHGRHWAAGTWRRALAYRALRLLGMRLVAVSEDLAAYLARGMRLPRRAFDVVHNGIPLPPPVPAAERSAARAAARVALGIAVQRPLVVAVGNLYPVKDHASLLRAVATLPGVRVAIAGRGEEEKYLRHLAAELGIESRMYLLGLRDDVDRVLAAADVFVQPSRHEGLPLAILEAMAAGLPVVATHVGGIPEAVVDGETSLLVPPADHPALAEALRKVLESPGYAEELGARGRARAEAEFSVARMVDRYEEMYAA